MLIHKPIKLDVPIREAVAWVGIIANETGTKEGHEAAQICAKVAASFDETHKVVIDIPAVQVLCALCDGLRAKGETAAVVEIEKIVALLKRGPQLITGTLHLGAKTSGELFGKLEALGNQVVAARERAK